MQLNIAVSNINGLPLSEQEDFQRLLYVFDTYKSKNCTKKKYYEGKISFGSVNLGIALPDTFNKLEVGCSWGAKTVDVLAARSMFDGFVGANGRDVEVLDKIAIDNDLMTEYAKACRDELLYGCTFATLSKDEKIGCKVRFHSPQSAAALWDGEKGRIKCGFAVIDSVPDNEDEFSWTPSLINYYTDDSVWVIEQYANGMWNAHREPNMMGRPLMEPLIWNATTDKPFGRSRIKEPIRRLIDGYVRTIANASIGLEFATSPQKYLLGVTDEQYDVVMSSKFKQYVGSIIAATWNPETGSTPTFGQLPQGNITPHVEMIRVLATQFSAATGLSVTDTGVVNDANPTSSDAILAQSQTLVAMAEELNKGNGSALRNIALMMEAIAGNKSLEALTEDELDIVAHFKNPAMPSVAITTDAAIKIASVREGFADTDTFLEMIGFDKAEVRRIKAQEAQSRGLDLLGGIDEDNEEAME